MASEEDSTSRKDNDYRVNFFRPRPGFMRRKVRYTWILLISWAFFTFGFQFLLVWVQDTPAGDSLITNSVIFGFPVHYWFSGQFLIVWFILLCFLFNVFVDNLTKLYRKRK
jgi:putative solute:sodium symporter small subunit